MHPTIRADDLALVLWSWKVRRHTRGLTAALAAMSAAPMIQVDCHCGSAPSADLLHLARRTHGRGVRIGPLSRGGIAQLYERTLRSRGRAEVQRTWGIGIRALREEPRHILRAQRAAA